MIDYYELLQVAPTASTEEIRKAFRRLAKQYHPDLQQHKSEAAQREAQRCFVQLTQAYETLSHSAQRQTYDTQWQKKAQRAKSSQTHQKTSANTSSSQTRTRSYESSREDFTDFAETSLEDLLKDVEGLLKQFGVQRTDPLEFLLEWARRVYREVMEAWHEENHSTDSASGAEQSRSGSEAHRPKEEKTQAHDDPRADIEAELERFKRFQRSNPQQTRRQTAEMDVYDELERLKRKYRP
jgi:DnaJ-class molecular chaperone